MATEQSTPRLRELALFAGGGGGILGGLLLGWRTVCAVEWGAYAASILVARQSDGTLEPFPIWDDVQTFDGRPWRGCVDVISGGFPCQDISSAGKGAGIDGAKSSMWRHMARIVGEVRPRYVFVENSPVLTSRGLGRVLGDLAALGYDAEWGVLGACDAGAPHRRERIWILATDSNSVGVREQYGHRASAETGAFDDGAPGTHPDTHGARREEALRVSDAPEIAGAGSVRNAERARLEGATGERLPSERGTLIESAGSSAGRWWDAEPDVGRVVDGLANRMDRLVALGNGQVPAVVALAWRALIERGAR